MHTSRSNKPRIIITTGDPSGIGPEVALKALASSKVRGLADFLLVGESAVIGKLRKNLGLKLEAHISDIPGAAKSAFRYGRIDAACGASAMRYLDKAINLIGLGEADALVTAPVNKAAIRSAGFPDFEGHTEYLAHKTFTEDFAMMFVGKALKITLVTRHIALKDVPRSLSSEKIFRVIALTHKYLFEYFGIKNPRIGVSGLNPHAGEGSNFGREEEDIIMPAVRMASAKFGHITGPLPPDAIFYDALNRKFDAVVAMYHDQALIPFKMLYFKDGVNVTIGLPFVRTSPDHGTAFDIAGKGIADPASMIEAIVLACRLSPKARTRKF